MLKTGIFILLAAALWTGCGKKAEDAQAPDAVLPPPSQTSPAGGPITSDSTEAPGGQAGGPQIKGIQRPGLLDYAFPSEWRTCAKDDQCARITVQCGGCDALNQDFLRDYEELISSRKQTPYIPQACPAMMNDTCRRIPVCRKGRCALF